MFLGQSFNDRYIIAMDEVSALTRQPCLGVSKILSRVFEILLCIQAVSKASSELRQIEFKIRQRIVSSDLAVATVVEW